MRKGSRSHPLWPALGLLCLAAGCSPELGDACRVSTDCSVQGDRECDTSQPGGYCTIEDCVRGDCQDEGHCVRFEPDQIRLATSWCVGKCGRGCRASYRCVNVAELNADRCGMDVEVHRELVDLTMEERRDVEVTLGEQTVAGDVAWQQLQSCLDSRPRAAEMLDDSTNSRFCSPDPARIDEPAADPEPRIDGGGGDSDDGG